MGAFSFKTHMVVPSAYRNSPLEELQTSHPRMSKIKSLTCLNVW